MSVLGLHRVELIHPLHIPPHLAATPQSARWCTWTSRGLSRFPVRQGPGMVQPRGAPNGKWLSTMTGKVRALSHQTPSSFLRAMASRSSPPHAPRQGQNWTRYQCMNVRCTVYVGITHQISFLRRYHPGIHVPSRVLADAVLDDAQAQVRQEDDGSALAKPTLTVVTDDRQRACVAYVGGPHRCDLRRCPV